MFDKWKAGIVLAAVLASGTPGAAGLPARPADRPDFSGMWILDMGRSVLNQRLLKNLTAGFFKIDHREPAFSIHREFTIAGKPDTLDFTYPTDGSEIEGNDQGMPTVSSLRWDGEALVYLTIYKTSRGEARNLVKYSLLDDGKTLRAEESFRGPRLQYINIWIFGKGETT